MDQNITVREEGVEEEEVLAMSRSRRSSVSSVASQSSAEGRGLRRRHDSTVGEDNSNEVGIAKRLRSATAGGRDPLLQVIPPSKKGETLPSVDQLRGELMGLPTADLTAEVLSQLEAVKKVASTSNNLNGPYVRMLKLAARTVGVAVSEMAQRAHVSGGETQCAAENATLKKEVSHLRDEVSKLRAAMESIHSSRGVGPQASVADESSSSGAACPRELTVVEAPLTSNIRVAPPAGERLKGGRRKSSSPSREDALLARIGAMVEEKLAAFQRDFLRGAAARRPSTAQPSAGGGKIKKGGWSGGLPPASQFTPPGPVARKPPIVEVTETASPPSSSGMTWAKVVGRKEKRVARRAAASQPLPSAPACPTRDKRAAPAARKGSNKVQGAAGRGVAAATPTSNTRKAKGGRVRLARPPKSAAVAVTIPEGATATYAEVMSAARSKIDLAAICIAAVRPRRAMTGGLLLEIPDQDGAAKADTLAAKMAEALTAMGVGVARPKRLAEVRVTGLDDSVTSAEVGRAIAATAECSEGEVRVGEIRRTSSGLGSVWARCPLSSVRRLIAAGRILVGWTSVRVEALPARPLRCFRCLQAGHVGQRCTAGVDRSNRCYRCGDPGHRASRCDAPSPRCPVCADLGRPAAHGLGGKGCAPAPRVGKKNKPAAQAAPAASARQVQPTALPAAASSGNGQEEAMVVEK